MKAIRNLNTLNLAIAALAATFLLVGTASARPIFIARFTLPSEVHWGKATLPAGDYEATLDSTRLRGLVAVRHANGQGAALVMPVQIYRTEAKSPSVLIISRRGNQATVSALRLAEAGLILRFERQDAHGRKAIEEANVTQEVPILAANK